MATESALDRRTRFISMLLTRGHFAWEETADPDTFQVKLDTFVVQVGRDWNDQLEEDIYRVTLLNSSGKVLEEITPRNIDAEALQQATGHDRYSAFRSLFETARRQALDVDESLEEAMKEIERHIPF